MENNNKTIIKQKKIMNRKLTLLERREIAIKTIPTIKDEKYKLKGLGLLLTMSHKKETYDYFNIPKFECEVEEYYENNPIVFDTEKGVEIKYMKQKKGSPQLISTKPQKKKKIQEDVVKVDRQKDKTKEETEIYCFFYKCSKCNITNIMTEDNYCPNCGCKIEWIGINNED